MKTLREALTKEYLKRLEEMAIRLKYCLSTDGYSGARRSMAKGSSLEFSDYREYAAGDDLRRGIAVVISDFMTDNGIEDTVKLLQQKKQEVLLVQVLSKEEEEPKVGGAVRLVDAETGESRDLELNEAMAAAYKKALMKQRAALREFCSRRDAVFAHVREDEDLLRVLYEMMR